MDLTRVKLRTLFSHIAIWTVLLLIPAFIHMPAHKEADFTSLPAAFFLGSNLAGVALFYWNAFTLYPRFMNRHYWWIYIPSILGIMGLLYFIKLSIIKQAFPAIPLDGNAHRFALFSALPFILASIIYRVVLDNIRRERKLKEIQANQLTTELKFLRSQVNPHFLFNVLTNIVSLARTGSRQLEPSLIMLADLMRYMLYDSGEKKVTISAESQYLKSYIQLQQLRFGDTVSITTHFEMDEEQARLTIEPMLLVPFVENAFKHGVVWVEQPAISISLTVVDGVLALSVSNRYNNLEDSKDPQPGIGLANVQTRLNLLYPGRHTLLQTEKDNDYLVHLTINLT